MWNNNKKCKRSCEKDERQAGAGGFCSAEHKLSGISNCGLEEKIAKFQTPQNSLDYYTPMGGVVQRQTENWEKRIERLGNTIFYFRARFAINLKSSAGHAFVSCQTYSFFFLSSTYHKKCT